VVDTKPLALTVIEHLSSGPYSEGKFGAVTQVPAVSSKHDPLMMPKASFPVEAPTRGMARSATTASQRQSLRDIFDVEICT